MSNPLHNAIDELEKNTKKAATKERLKANFQRVKQEAKQPQNRGALNHRGENGLQALMRIFNEIRQELKQDFKELIDEYQKEESPQISESTMDKMQRAIHRVENVADLAETLQEVYQYGDKPLESFSTYFEAYRDEIRNDGFPLSIRNAGEFSKNLEDKNTLRSWYTLAQSLDGLETEGFVEKLNLKDITANKAFDIVKTAYNNLSQTETKSLAEYTQAQAR